MNTCKVFWKSNSIRNSTDIANNEKISDTTLAEALERFETTVSEQQIIPSQAESLLPSFSTTAQIIPALPPSLSHPTTSSSLQCYFAPAKTDIEEARRSGIPKKTLENTRYCLNLWKEWITYRHQTTSDTIMTEIENMTNHQLEHWLTWFVLEVRKKDGCVYPPASLHHICAGLMRYFRWNGKPETEIFKDSQFANFRATLDGEMKHLQAQGIGLK